MKLITSLLLLVIISTTTLINNVYCQDFKYETSEDEKITFIRWSNTFNRIYSSDEFTNRFQIFLENKQYVEQFNSNSKSSMVLGLNVFADLSLDEFNHIVGGTAVGNNIKRNYHKVTRTTTTTSSNGTVDWRDHLPPIKNQGECDASYAFASIATIEAGLAIENGGHVISLSEQEIIDCSSDNGNQGCAGGFGGFAYNYVLDNKGVSLESGYPYSGVQGNCKQINKKYGAISDYIYVNSQESIENTLSTIGPLITLIQTNLKSFQLYKGGVYDDPNYGPNYIYNTIASVGYGVEDNIPYFLLRNSWGTGWGIGGYMMAARSLPRINDIGYYPVMLQ